MQSTLQRQGQEHFNKAGAAAVEPASGLWPQRSLSPQRLQLREPPGSSLRVWQFRTGVG